PLALAGPVVLAAAILGPWRSSRAPRSPRLATAARSSEPYVLCFTGDGCAVCGTHQEPALAKLGAVRIDRVDALSDRGLADLFQVYTLPTTVVMSAEGKALNVNYGYAPAPKLQQQLADARGNLRAAATA